MSGVKGASGPSRSLALTAKGRLYLWLLRRDLLRHWRLDERPPAPVPWYRTRRRA